MDTNAEAILPTLRGTAGQTLASAPRRPAAGASTMHPDGRPAARPPSSSPSPAARAASSPPSRRSAC